MSPFRGAQLRQGPLLLVFLLATSCVLVSGAGSDCNETSVKKMMQLFTNEFASECTPESLNKLIDYYGDLRNKSHTGGCKPILRSEVRKLIVDKLAHVINKSGEQPDRLEQLQQLVKRVDRGVIVSTLDVAYWSVDNRQTLRQTLQRLDEGAPRVLALKALQQLDANNGDVQQHMNEICDATAEYCTLDKNSYPPKEILKALDDIKVLNRRCQGRSVQSKLQQLLQETRNVYRGCYIKLKKTIQYKVNVFKKLEQSTLHPSGGTCNVSEVADGIDKFELALKYIDRKC